MKYVQPFDQPSNPTAAYVDLNAATGTDGSIPPAKFFNDMQAEILNVITNAGLTPNAADMTQLRQAILAMIPTPTGAPADASLVHYAVDASASANNIALTPTPSVSGLTIGLTIFFKAANTVTGVSTLTMTPSSGPAVSKPLVRSNGEVLSAGDIVANSLYAAVYDPSTGINGSWRLCWDDRIVIAPYFARAQGTGTQSVSIYVPANKALMIHSSYAGSEDTYGGWPSDYVVGNLITSVNGQQYGSYPIRSHLNWIDIWSAGRANLTAFAQDMMIWSAPSSGTYTFSAQARNLQSVSFAKQVTLLVYGV